MKCGTSDYVLPEPYDEYIKQAMEEVAKEIDFSVISKLMIQSGWIRVELDRFENRKVAIDIQDWLTENCIGQHSNYGKTFIFEKKQDAEWFVLRWM